MLCVACGTEYTDEASGPSAAANGTAQAEPRSSATSSTSFASSSGSSSSLLAAANSASSPSRPLVLHVNGAAPAARAQSAASGLVRRRRDEEEDEDDSDDEEEADSRATLSVTRGGAGAHHSTASSPASATPVTPSPPLESDPVIGVSEVSGRLSEKLLQGWTMLAEECPNPSCSCPLVRKRNGPRLCVQCGAAVVTQEEKEQMDKEEEAKAQPPQQPQTQQRTKEEEKVSTASTAQLPEPPSDAKGKAGGKQKRTSFQSSQRADDHDAEGAKRAKEDELGEADAFSDRLSSLNSSTLVTSLSQSPLVRHSQTRPSAISSTRRFTPALVDSSPSTRTPPSTPAPYPFNSPLPASQHLTASISSAFSHPVYPPPGHITRANSQASDFTAFPQQNVGLGSLSFFQPPATLPAQRQQLHTPGGHEKGKFSFRASSAAPSLASGAGAPGNSRVDGFLAAPQPGQQSGSEVTTAPSTPTPPTVSPVAGNAGGGGGVGTAMFIVQSSVEVLFGKLDSLRALLSACGNVEQMTLIAAAMKEVGAAIRTLQSL